VVGVTGTKGKSTTIELINAILEEAGKKTALLSSIRIKIADKSEKNLTDNTMPGRFFIQAFLRKAVNSGCEVALIEVTSQGVVQYRHCFIHWSAAIFTNLAPEHIEAHGSFEKYREAKLSFFRHVSKLQKAKSKEQKLFFINKDDPSARYFIEAAKGGKIILFSKDDISFSRFSLPGFLATDFNLENVAAAVSFSQTIDIEEGIIKKALENFSGVPGRMEIVQNEPFKVIIDYAHTPDSLRKVYEAIKSKILPSQIFKKNLGGQEIQSSKLICILGSAGGGRDKWKRPKMGEIATNYCDEIILTNEDPYNENPLQIIKDIESGFSQNQKSKFQITKNYWIILDRQEAIKKAVSLAKKGDVIIITGKGCESWIHVENGKKIPWNEKEAVKKALDSYITKVNA